METIWVLLWSKYSADNGLYPYHIETLAEYIQDGWRHHDTWIDNREQSHHNLWILLHVGSLSEVQARLDTVFKSSRFAGDEKSRMLP